MPDIIVVYVFFLTVAVLAIIVVGIFGMATDKTLDRKATPQRCTLDDAHKILGYTINIQSPKAQFTMASPITNLVEAVAILDMLYHVYGFGTLQVDEECNEINYMGQKGDISFTVFLSRIT